MREKLCLPSQPRLQCRDINSGAFDTALELASGEARDRFLSLGTRLVFDDDKVTAVKKQQSGPSSPLSAVQVSPWGPGWEFSFGLHYSTINETHTR